jgi:hypothetical protein
VDRLAVYCTHYKSAIRMVPFDGSRGWARLALMTGVRDDAPASQAAIHLIPERPTGRPGRWMIQDMQIQNLTPS